MLNRREGTIFSMCCFSQILTCSSSLTVFLITPCMPFRPAMRILKETNQSLTKISTISLPSRHVDMYVKGVYKATTVRVNPLIITGMYIHVCIAYSIWLFRLYTMGGGGVTPVITTEMSMCSYLLYKIGHCWEMYCDKTLQKIRKCFYHIWYEHHNMHTKQPYLTVWCQCGMRWNYLCGIPLPMALQAMILMFDGISSEFYATNMQQVQRCQPLTKEKSILEDEKQYFGLKNSIFNFFP